MARRSSIARKDARTESPSDDARWRRQVATVVVAITMAIGSQVPTASAAGLVGTARADSYSVMTGEVLVVPDPGVLDNDTVVAGSAAAELRNDVDHGTLDLDEDGGFRYEPAAGFVGTDRFTYRIPGGLLLLLPSAPATVTISVTDPPPTPTPTPTPPPPPTPAPTAKPTPAPTPPPTPRPPTPPPTIGPSVTLPPLPLPSPVPSLLPGPTATPSPRPTPQPTPPPTRAPSSTPGPTAPLGTPAAGVARGPLGPPGDGAGPTAGSGPNEPTANATTPPFAVPGTTALTEIDIDPTLTLAGFEWAIPALVLTVPGILLLLALLAQAVVGALWLPVARRWLGGDRRGRAVRVASVSAA